MIPASADPIPESTRPWNGTDFQPSLLDTLMNKAILEDAFGASCHPEDLNASPRNRVRALTHDEVNDNTIANH